MEIEYISPSIIRAGVVTRLPQLHSLLYFYPAYLFLSMPDILWVTSPKLRELLRYTFF